MRTPGITLALMATLAGPQAGWLQGQEGPASPQASRQDPPPPPTPAPKDPPPPPPAERPEPPSRPQEARPHQEAADGQWVYTEQYGWVWMPYGDRYTHVPPDGSTPNMYVYYPEVGWCWVLAPWLWGWGPMPFFGRLGPFGFGWYGIGFGRWYGFARPYAFRGWEGRGFWRDGRWNGIGGHGGAFRGGGFRGGFGHGLGRGFGRGLHR